MMKFGIYPFPRRSIFFIFSLLLMAGTGTFTACSSVTLSTQQSIIQAYKKDNPHIIQAYLLGHPYSYKSQSGNILTIYPQTQLTIHSFFAGKETLMTLAGIYGSINIAKLLLKNKAPIDQKDAIGNTALLWAAYDDHPKMINFLLKNKASTKVINIYQQGFLDFLFWRIKTWDKSWNKLLPGNADYVLLSPKKIQMQVATIEKFNSVACPVLLKEKNSSTKSKSSSTPVSACQIFSRFPPTYPSDIWGNNLAHLLSFNPNADKIWSGIYPHPPYQSFFQFNLNAQTALDLLAQKDNWPLLEKILKSYPGFYRYKDYRGNSLMLTLIKNKANKCISKLKKMYPNTPWGVNVQGNNAYLLAAQNINGLKSWLPKTRSAQLHKNKLGQSALMQAVKGKQLDNVQFLLKQVPSICSLKDNDQNTAIDWAINLNQTDIAVALINNIHCPLQTLNKKKQSLLILAIMHKNQTVANALLDHHARLDQKDDLGRTPLVWDKLLNLNYIQLYNSKKN